MRTTGLTADGGIHLVGDDGRGTSGDDIVPGPSGIVRLPGGAGGDRQNGGDGSDGFPGGTGKRAVWTGRERADAPAHGGAAFAVDRIHDPARSRDRLDCRVSGLNSRGATGELPKGELPRWRQRAGQQRPGPGTVPAAELACFQREAPDNI